MKLKISVLMTIIIATFLGSYGNSFARKWKPTPTEDAQDYLTIDHGISDREKVILIWFAPEYLEKNQETEDLRKVLQKYMMVGIMHFSVDELGLFTIKSPEMVTAEYSELGKIASISAEDLPPVVASVSDVLKKIIAGGAGKIGDGLRVFIFDGEQFDQCSNGTMKINYLAEQYTFDTPLPGCGQ